MGVSIYLFAKVRHMGHEAKEPEHYAEGSTAAHIAQE